VKLPQYVRMGEMLLRVQSVRVGTDAIHAIVVAVSRERTSGEPRASLQMRLSLETVQGESIRQRVARVRDEARRYLKVS
jgi:hypothetical protein